VPAPEQKQDLIFIDQQLLVKLNNIGDQLDAAQLWWASGYLAGRASNTDEPAATESQSEPDNVAANWTILYGTETGNAHALTQLLSEQASAAGLITSSNDLRDYKPAALKKEQNLLLVIATHGLGEPPDGTEDFFDYLMSDRAPRFENLNYSVLALGDSSYDDFCATGKMVDARLAELGGNRLHERVDCDLDFESTAQSWIETVVSKAKEAAGADQRPAVAVAHLHAVAPQRVTRQHPFMAEALVNQKITGRGSSKDVRHIELSLEGSDTSYLPGDALGVMPLNPPQLVAQYLQQLGFDAETPVNLDDHVLSLQEALSKQLEITRLSRGFLKDYADETGDQQIIELLNNKNKPTLQRYLNEYQPIDVLNEFSHNISAQALVSALRKLTPRLYSIASSPDANPDEVHLAVAVVRYQALSTPHWGSASNFLADNTTDVPVYVQANPHFHLPQDTDARVIMIGAGTGIAPFRAFIEHRRFHAAKGQNWLIFGDRNFSSDFLYQLEWQRYLKQGSLQRMDLAFSRDQAQKIYVQQRIREQGRDIYDWLENGAHLYMCGDALNMAPDVHQALIDVIGDQRGVNPQSAEDYLRNLKRNGRYQRDVY